MKKMTTRIALLGFCLFAQSGAFAKGVDETTAKSVGANYLMSVGVSGVKSSADLVTSYVPQSTVGSTVINNFYVFNIAGRDGFVMVSGDDRVIPILAYSDESSFDINKISPSAADWINGYKNQITYVVGHTKDAKKGTPENWKALIAGSKGNAAAKTTAVTPLVTTKWDQDPYYNAQCPSGTVTGCVATAMAQILKFWNWPSVGSGMHSYVHPTYGTISANFGTTAYQWSSMPNSVTASNSAVATLMKHCGVSVNMNYGTASSGGSSAPTINASSDQVNCAEYAFKTYFHYKTTVKGVARYGSYPGASDSFTTASWISLLETELNAGRPMLYSGFGTTDGHAWVCDGWQAAGNLMHFNWGWSGTGPNGYYSVNNIAPPALGIGGGGGDFNARQSVIMGIQPDTYPSYTGNIKMLSYINFSTPSPINYNSGFSFKAKIQNGGTTAFAGDVCAQVYDASNNLMGTVQTMTGVNIPAGDSSALLSFTTTGILNMVANIYNVRIMYRSGSGAWTPVGNNGLFINYGMIDVRNDSTVRLYDTVKVTSGTPLVTGHSVNITTKIFNYDVSDFYGTVKATLTNVATGTVTPIQSIPGQTIAAYFFSPFTFSTGALTATPGTYALEIQHQYNSAGSFYVTGAKDKPNPILVQVVFPADVNSVAEVPNDIFVYPNPAKDQLNVIFNNHKVSEVTVTDLSGRVVYTSDVDENAATMKLSLDEYASGMYLVQFRMGSEVMTKKITIEK